MAKNAPLPATESPELVPVTVERSPARAAAITKLIADGYRDDEGKVRTVHGIAHAEFLAATGTISPLPE